MRSLKHKHPLLAGGTIEEIGIFSKKKRPKKRLVLQGKAAKAKMHKAMHDFKVGSMHAGKKSGPVVRSRKQAIAIALSQARKASKKNKNLIQEDLL